MTNAAAAASDPRILPRLIRAYRTDEAMGNYHTGIDADRVIALSLLRFTPKGGRTYRLATDDAGRPWLASKGRDGRYWPVAALCNLPDVAVAG